MDHDPRKSTEDDMRRRQVTKKSNSSTVIEVASISIALYIFTCARSSAILNCENWG